jgi:2-amino-4-hydroxy-6-hydroxymethyldihydropteridine diphosphokinase
MSVARQVAFSLGGNLGDREQAIGNAVAALNAVNGLNITALSPLYQTAPWGKTDQDWFLNACAVGRTTLPASALLQAVQGIENRLGRVREERWGPRLIDIDIIALDGVAHDDEDLTLPHPRAAERAFVLVPLADIAPDLMIGKMKVRDILLALPRVEGDVVPYP